MPSRGEVGLVVDQVGARVPVGRDDRVALVGHGQIAAGSGSSPLAMASARACSRAPASSRFVADDERARLDAAHDESPELVEVHDLGVATGRPQLLPKLLEGRARGGRTWPLPGERGRTVALCGPQARLQQAAGGVEDRRRELGSGVPQLMGQRLGQARDRRLARRVHRGVGHRGDPAVARRGVDHHPGFPRVDHPRHERHDPVGDAEHVDAEAPLPVVGLLLPRPPAAAGGDAGVVAQQVTRSVTVEDLGRQSLHRGVVGHVRGDPRHLPQVGQLRDGLLEHRLLDVRDDDVGPFLEERPDDATSDPVCTPGDDGHLVLQIGDHPAILSRCYGRALAGAVRPRAPRSGAPGTRARPRCR